MKRFWLAGLLLLTLTVAPVILIGQAEDRPDLDAVYKIKDEGFERTTVMELVRQLTDIHGPRLTNSPNIKAAASWTKAKMGEWGLVNVKQEPWGPFGRGWSSEKFYLHAIAPQRFPIIGFAKAWTPGTGGLVNADVGIAVIAFAADTETLRGKLKGKIVLTSPAAVLTTSREPLASRYSDDGRE